MPRRYSAFILNRYRATFRLWLINIALTDAVKATTGCRAGTRAARTHPSVPGGPPAQDDPPAGGRFRGARADCSHTRDRADCRLNQGRHRQNFCPTTSSQKPGGLKSQGPYVQPREITRAKEHPRPVFLLRRAFLRKDRRFHQHGPDGRIPSRARLFVFDALGPCFHELWGDRQQVPRPDGQPGPSGPHHPRS